MTVQLRAAIARIRQAKGRVVGAGFLVSDQHILTCAHVVNAALGKQLNTPDQPNQEIDLDFPLVASGNTLRGRVVRWIPVQRSSDILPETGADIALLELESTLPEGTQPVRLVKAETLWKHPFRVFGFPEGQAVGVSTYGIISNPQANGRVQIDVHGTYPIESGFSGSPVWDEQLDGVAGMTVAIDPKRPQVRAAFIIPTTQLINACPELEEQAIPPCPYRGLFAFREQDAKFFFGREQFTQQLVKAVHKQSLVAVIGASGSGKSSVVFAGLIPQLRSEEGWLIEVFRPEDRPLRNLTKTLVALRKIQTIDPLDQIDQMLEKFQEGKRKLRDVIEDILDRNNRTRLLLIADQFEELYTLCKDKSELQIFLDLFLEAVNQTENFTLVLTLRADFCGYALSYRPFADALQDADRKLGPMNQEELQKVIEQPAQLLGVRIESGLTERILEAVEDEPGYLPLLEFALTLLWAKQQNGQLTHQAYEDIGGVEKALAEYAEEEYQNLSEEDKQRAQRVFIQLVRPGAGTEDTRRLATRDEVGEDNWDLVTRKEGLADARLVVTNKTEKTEGKVETDQETVEIIHEALIREWGTLRGWMEVNREFRTWQERLKVRMQEWGKSNRDDGALLWGVPLAEAENWLQKRFAEIGENEKDFITASVDLRNIELKLETEQREQEKKLLQAAVEAYINVLGELSLDHMSNKNHILGQIKVLDDDVWTKLPKSEEKIFSILRDYGDGKVFAAGHNGVLGDANTSRILLISAFGWLNLSSNNKSVLISSGHSEIISFKGSPFNTKPPLALKKLLNKWGSTVGDIVAPIDDTKLKKGNILVVGDAWGNFTQSEIDAVENFVKNGGSLFVVGLGWSWKQYSENPPEFPGFCEPGQQEGQNTQDMLTYPMNRLVEPYKMQWTEYRFD
ncbi:MAG: trypsin-like serine protease [Moorea sp. SIO4G2]|nr:trypsin-like serine protease [Moorena sp. SIO4G2]